MVTPFYRPTAPEKFIQVSDHSAFTNSVAGDFASRGWSVEIATPSGGGWSIATQKIFRMTRLYEVLSDMFDTAYANKVPVWLALNRYFNNVSHVAGGWLPANTEAEYEAAFGWAFDILDADSRISGYSFEGGFNNGLAWLSKRTKKPVRNDIVPGMVSVTFTGGVWVETLNSAWFDPGEKFIDRAKLCTGGVRAEWIAEYSDLAMTKSLGQYCVDMKAYLAAGAPGIKFGYYHSCDDDTTYPWWGEHWIHTYPTPPPDCNGADPPCINYAAKVAAATYWLPWARDNGLGLVDFIGNQATWYVNAGGHTTFADIMDLDESLNLISSTVVKYNEWGAVVTDCEIEYTTWPVSGTIITNEGNAGATYDGVAYDNDYSVLPSLATSFILANAEDKITIDNSAKVNDLGAFTMEFLVYYSGGVASPVLFRKTNTTGFFRIWISSSDGRVQIRRYMDDSSYYNYRTAASTVAAGNMYDIQVTWDSTTVTNAPLLRINGVSVTLTKNGTGTGTVWASDSSYDAHLFNDPTNASYLYGTIAVYRLHSAVLAPAALDINYLADKWRLYDRAITLTTVPTCSAAAGVVISTWCIPMTSIDVADVGATPASVLLLDLISVDLHSTMVDVTPFDAEYTAERPSVYSASFSSEGFFDYYDTITQHKLIMDNAINGTELTARVQLPAEDVHISCGIIITDFTIKTSAQDLIRFSFTAESTGGISYI